MKTKKIKYYYSIIVILFIEGFVYSLSAQNELDKTKVWKFKSSELTEVILNNYECDVEIDITGGNEVTFEMSVYAESSDEKDIKKLQEFLDNLKFNVSEERIEISTQLWQKMNSTSFLNTSKSEVTLLNGEKITLSEFEREATLKIPESVFLKLESKYSTLTLDNLHRFELKSYNDKIYGNNLRQPAKIEAKYSKMEFEETKNLSLDLYDCTFEANNSEITSIKSKYSDIEIENTSTISIDSYDDKFDFEKTGNITIVSKYTDFSLGECENMTLDIYDSNFEIDELKNLIIKESKYSSLEFDQANNIQLLLSYDDEISAGIINSIDIKESKYSTYEIETLKSVMTINGYDDNILIEDLEESFKLFEADIKYGKIVLDISSELSVELDVKSKYGKLTFDKEEFDTQIHLNKDDELEYKGYKGKKSDNLPLIKVRGYDMSLTL